MKQIAFGLITVVSMASAGAFAEERRMTGEEISQALTNNTWIGTDSKPPWKQFFNEDGTTWFEDGRSPTSYGLWEVRNHAYCSEWGGGAWSCYKVNKTAEGIVWIGKERGDRYPAKLFED